jgi:hypothetical protein
MLHPDTAMHAVRLLGVDAANLMTKLAVYQATAEELMELSAQVDERSWEHITEEDPHQGPFKAVLPDDQRVIVQRILMLINALR